MNTLDNFEIPQKTDKRQNFKAKCRHCCWVISGSLRVTSNFSTQTACKYCAIPATSAPLEKLFSIAGKGFRPDRIPLNDDTFETRC